MKYKLLAASLITTTTMLAALPFSAMAQETTSPQSVPQPQHCVVLTKNLFRGSHDNDVSLLQQFLVDEGYSQPVTGYFGVLTWGNLMKFQHSHSVQATGFFGPLTRAVIASKCSGTSTGGGTIGGLTVTTPMQGQIVQSGSELPISWKYATSSPNTTIKLELFTASGESVGTITNTNSATSTYTWGVPPFPNTRLCMMIYPNALCGSNLSGQYYIRVSAVSGMGFDQNATVYASGNSGVFTITHDTIQNQPAISATPTSGSAPLTVTFMPNSAVNTYAISFGDGSSTSMQTGITTHVYTNPGTYTATFTSDFGCMHTNPRCMIAVMSFGNATITVH